MCNNIANDIITDLFTLPTFLINFPFHLKYCDLT